MAYGTKRNITRAKFVAFVLIFHLASFIFSSCGPSQKTTKTPTPIPAPPPSSPKIPQPVQAAPEAPVHISVTYPVPGQWRPAVDSNFIFGTVGNGNASLTINGTQVPLAKNGAFLAFLPMPKDGAYHLFAERNDPVRGVQIDSGTVSYRSGAAIPATPEAPKAKYEAFPSPVLARVVRGSDTLQTGNDVAPGAPEPDGNRKWFFPRGTILKVLGKMGKYYKLELGRETGWVADTNLDLHASASSQAGFDAVRPADKWVDVLIASGHAPFLITTEGEYIHVTIYRKPDEHAQIFEKVDPWVMGVTNTSSGQFATCDIQTNGPVWGYKAFYLPEGSLVVRVRRPPEIDKTNPLQGLKIMLDPGHPPLGAVGPTGLTEKEANLAEALKLRDLLTARGAQVMMTHTTLSGLVSDVNQVEELSARAALAVSSDADILLSIHNNAFPDGTNPFLNYGTSTFYYWRQSAALAAALDREIATVTGIPNLGAMEKSLAICRPTWMPSSLTESLYLMFPDQESALRDPKFLQTLAEAHVRGLESFLRAQIP
jgi:N-acetylmuramoyl-L-alanine amidase